MFADVVFTTIRCVWIDNCVLVIYSCDVWVGWFLFGVLFTVLICHFDFELIVPRI